MYKQTSLGTISEGTSSQDLFKSSTAAELQSNMSMVPKHDGNECTTLGTKFKLQYGGKSAVLLLYTSSYSEWLCTSPLLFMKVGPSGSPVFTLPVPVLPTLLQQNLDVMRDYVGIHCFAHVVNGKCGTRDCSQSLHFYSR